MITQRLGVVQSVAKNKWRFTINTEAITTGAVRTGIPFNLYGQDNAVLRVDWGDGSFDTFTSTNYSSGGENSISIHVYAQPGVYQITVLCNKPEDIYIDIERASASVNQNIDLFRKTLVSLDGAIPSFKGVRRFYNQQYIINDDSINTLFYYCTKLVFVDQALLEDMINLTDVSYLFYGCFSLPSIPALLFKNNVNITNMDSVFRDCSSLSSIPQSLFDNNDNITSFRYTFYGCTSLTSIPEGLFDNNVFVTEFYYTFGECSSITQIPDMLFSKNIACISFYRTFRQCTSLADVTLYINSPSVTNCSSVIYPKNTSATRIIYVPANSTTQTTFNSVASSLGLTIIGV